VNGRFHSIGGDIALNLVTMVLSLTVHEYSHARVADILGDDTPRKQGRLTLSPLAHYDLLGTIIFPILSAFAGGIAFIGWARPVQTNPERYTRRLSMRNGHRLVALAGPLSNLCFAAVATAAYAVLVPHYAAPKSGISDLLRTLALVNIGLFVLNMLPLPPLDGSRLLPKSLDEVQRAILPYSFFILLLFFNLPLFRTAFYVPIGAIYSALNSAFGLSVGQG
jgi:Zn-dependent protease